MKTTKSIFILILAFMLSGLFFNRSYASELSNKINKECSSSNENKLVVIWSSDDPMVAKRVALMYPHDAQRTQWFDEVILVVL